MKFPEKMQQRIDRGDGCGAEIGDGWIDIVIDLDKQIDKIDPSYTISQIKEKFGGLRYYISTSPILEKEKWDEIYDLIEEAESKASHTCEVCGKFGSLITKGWMKTRCEEHK